MLSVVIFWNGDNEESGEIKTHGLSDQGDSDDRQIRAARVKQHFKVSVQDDVLLEAPDYCYLQVLQRWGGSHPEAVRNLKDTQTC